MKKYHISPITGSPRICHAQPEKCPLNNNGEIVPHFKSKREAEEYAEKALLNNSSIMDSSKKVEQDSFPPYHELSYNHYSNDSVLNLYNVHQSIDFKPQGLWLSIDGQNGWKEFCTYEDMPIGKEKHNIKLSPNSNILQINTIEEIEDFGHKYGYSRVSTSNFINDSIRSIRWDKVQEKHQGILISSHFYDYSHTDKGKWYYGWDFASACIWDKKAIENIS